MCTVCAYADPYLHILLLITPHTSWPLTQVYTLVDPHMHCHIHTGFFFQVNSFCDSFMFMLPKVLFALSFVGYTFRKLLFQEVLPAIWSCLCSNSAPKHQEFEVTSYIAQTGFIKGKTGLIPSVSLVLCPGQDSINIGMLDVPGELWDMLVKK